MLNNISRRSVTTFQIAATYVGTVVGAGFASGQEVLQFFGYFRIQGGLGLVFAGALFAYFGYTMLEIGRRIPSASHVQVIRRATGGLYPLVDLIITFFLFGGLTAMIAGSGAIFVEQFGLPFAAGGLVMAGLTTITVLWGLEGVITAISLFVPVLLTSVGLLTLASLVRFGLNLQLVASALSPASAPVRSLPLSSVVYVSYNLLLTAAVLAPVGAAANSKQKNMRGAILGGIGLALGALAIHLSVLSNLPEVLDYEVPMAFIAARFGDVPKLLFGIVLLGEIYTTAVANLYGFSARAQDPARPGFKIAAILVALAAFVASRFGFSAVVRTVYPVAGYAGLLLMLGLLVSSTRRNIR